MRPAAPLLACTLVALVVAAAGCRTPLASGVRVPGGSDKVYVSIYVDETEQGEVGVALAEEVQREIYRRDPERLAWMFDETSVILDGTIEQLKEKPSGDGVYEVRLISRAVLKAKDGSLVADLGTAESVATYEVYRQAERTDRARRTAIVVAARKSARKIVEQIDAAGAS